MCVAGVRLWFKEYFFGFKFLVMNDFEILHVLLTDKTENDANAMYAHFCEKGYVPVMLITEGNEFEKVKEKILKEDKVVLKCIARFMKYLETYHC